MSRNWQKNKSKMVKKENLEKRAKQKKIILLLCIFALLLSVSGLIVFSGIKKNNNEAEIYSYHGQTIQLFTDGKFTASLAHNVTKNGTYIKTLDNDRIIVSFNVNGVIEVGRIINDSLHIPGEWDDRHGHGNVFPKINQAKSNRGHNH